MIDETEHDEQETRKPRRRLKVIAALCTVLLLVLVGEFLASRYIADKLRKTVEDKLNAHLELGPLIYVPPYGAWTWDAKIVRDGRELLSIAHLRVSLAELPLGKEKPLVISSLSIDRPVLSLAPRSTDDIAKPSPQGAGAAPKKLSDMLRLKEVRLTDGQVRYTDTSRPEAPPTVWSNLSFDLDTIQQSASRYTFSLISRSGTVADATASGTFDVDELLLDVQSSSVRLRAEPEPARSPLPAVVQQFIRRHRISGTMTVSGSGQVPLRDWKNANAFLNIALANGTAALPPDGQMLDHARASLTARLAPGQPVRVAIERIDVARGGRQVLVTAAAIGLDTTAQMWNVDDVKGQVTFAPPIHSAGNALLAPSSSPTSRAEEPRGIDRYRIAGKGEFTASASGPFDLSGRDPWQAIRHEVILVPRDASFVPKKFAHRIEGITGGEIRLQDGVIVLHDLFGHYGEDLLRLGSARLPVEGLPKLARWQDISGTIHFHRPVRRYTDKLDKILQALEPDGLFAVGGSFTADKRGLPDDAPAKKTYDLIVTTDKGSFSLTDHHIVLEKMRGEATVTHDGVDVHELEAEVFDGTLQTTGRWVREDDERSAYEAEAVVRDLDLARIEERFRDEPAARPLEGRVYGATSLSGTVSKGAPTKQNLAQLRAAGEVEIVRGSLFQMPVIKSIAEQIKGLEGAANVGDAAARFDIEKGRVKLSDAAVSSPVVGLQGGGEVHFSGDIYLQVVAAPLADWREKLKETKIPLVSDVAGELAGGIQKMLNAATGALLYEFRVTGSIDKHQVIAVPTPVLTDTAAFVFEKMLAPPKKDQRPIELLRHRPRPSTRAETR